MKRFLKGTMVSLVLGLTLFSRGVDVKAEDNVKRFVIPDDVTEIPAYYFNDLQDVEEIVLGENVSEVYFGAFDNCPNVKKLVINKNCEEIDEYALSGLTGLESIEVEKGNEEFVVKDNALFTKSMKTLIAYPRMCKKNKTFTVPEKTKQIFDTAFTNNAYIKKMIIKGDARDGQFWYCEKYACRGMKSLTTVIFKSKQIKHQLGFRDCKKLKKVVLANGTKTIKQRQFAGCKNLVSLNFPRSIKTAYENSFDGCKKLKIPKRIKTIGKKNRFIIIDEMGEKELIAYTGIKKAVVKVPDGVGRINGAFEDNKYIKKIILPDSVKEIWANSFCDLNNLKEIKFSNHIWCIESNSFMHCPKVKEIYIPSNMKGINSGALCGFEKLEKIRVNKKNKHYKVYREALYTKDGSKLVLYPRMCKKYKTYVIPEYVEFVDDTAFTENEYIRKLIIRGDICDGSYEGGACREMKNLKSVIFEKTQTCKQPISFAGCIKLESVVLAEGTKYIGFGQFKDCKNLTKINIPKSIEGIGKDAFDGCEKLALPEFDEKLLRNEW